MDRKAHSITMEAFMYPSEDRLKVLKSLSFVFPFEKAKDEKIESYYGPAITKMVVTVVKPKEVASSLNKISENLSDKDRKEIISSINERLDKEGNFYMRFSKQEAFDENLFVQYKGDVIKVIVKMAGYPYNRDNAKRDLVKIFEK